VVLPASGVASKWCCQQVVLPASGVASKWCCQQVLPASLAS
jgi:hypothetical protein